MSKNAICNWDFTLKKTDDIDEEIIKTILKEHCKNYAFQLEKGETGYIHYQGRISLKIKSRVGPPLFNAHWSPTSNENKSNNFYVIKSETRILGPWTDKDRDVYIPRQYRNIELFEWQKSIIKSADIFDTRTINILVDYEGCKGKSTCGAIADLLHDCIAIPFINDHKELMQLTHNKIVARNTHTPKLICCDMPKSINKDHLNAFYSTLESIKNGQLYDPRNHYKEWYIDSPAIWVFTNKYPDLTLLSSDRWKIWQIKDGALIPFVKKLVIKIEKK